MQQRGNTEKEREVDKDKWDLEKRGERKNRYKHYKKEAERNKIKNNI